ncbi:Cytochrome c2 [Mariprofundus ferrinatatus]|uniref:Cytochrome c2 n=1 Tax=Mariprofundus ferrinatatus TaxID=1921087 RepID=A0A2K8L4P0_9PROT|nr:immunoglobulin-like domain-containing protein [Mariprofundus ferrinatatus]ATX82288.1 Cytochrome c2 [Mariprofundus ferrinatatus]
MIGLSFTLAITFMMLAAPASVAAAKPDSTPPVIKLIGADSVTIQVGESYRDAGAKASDDVDGDISASIRSVSTLDTSKPGTYAVAYNVNDAAGNAAASVFRFVKVVEAAAEPAAEPAVKAAPEPVAPAATAVTAPAVETVIEDTAEPATEPAVETVVEEVAEPAPETKPAPAAKADTRPPVIKLRGEASISINEGEEFIDPGATAWDMVDGNLTSRIRVSGEVNTSRPAAYMISYNVSDRAGNSAKKVSRFVTVLRTVDMTPPVITLKGGDSLTLVEDEKYIEAGFTAMDEVDGDLTARVEQGGMVNTARPGTYTLKYFVADRADNRTIIERKITVTPRGDAAAGEALAMKKCASCHNITSTKKKFGPGLKGVYGRKAGSMDDFNYSSWLGAGKWSWDKENLKIWLGENTKEAVKKVSGNPDARTKMNFRGLSGDDLDNIIAFLKRNR